MIVCVLRRAEQRAARPPATPDQLLWQAEPMFFCSQCGANFGQESTLVVRNGELFCMKCDAKPEQFTKQTPLTIGWADDGQTPPALQSAIAQVETTLGRIFTRQAQKAADMVTEFLAVKKLAKGEYNTDFYEQEALRYGTTFQGLPILVENPVGSTRSGVSPEGIPWSTTMSCPYGEILGTMGVDGDPVDCFLGPNPDATHAYVVHTTQPDVNHESIPAPYDEDKVMLGWDSPEAALAAFMDNYTDPAFFRHIEAVPMDEFKEQVLATADNPASMRLGKAAPDYTPLIRRILDMTDAEFQSLPGDIQDALVASATLGADTGLGQLKIADSSPIFNRVNTQAAEYATNRAAEMVGMKWVDGELVPNPDAQWVISDTTRTQITNLVTNAFEQTEGTAYIGLDQLAEQIERAGAFSPARAEVIARAEVKTSATHAHWQAWYDAGIVSKVGWLLSNNENVCDICQAIVAEGPYAIEDAPLPVRDSHPRCQCSIVATEMYPAGQEKQRVAKTVSLAKIDPYRDAHGRFTAGPNGIMISDAFSPEARRHLNTTLNRHFKPGDLPYGVKIVPAAGYDHKVVEGPGGEMHVAMSARSMARQDYMHIAGELYMNGQHAAHISRAGGLANMSPEQKIVAAERANMAERSFLIHRANSNEPHTNTAIAQDGAMIARVELNGRLSAQARARREAGLPEVDTSWRGVHSDHLASLQSLTPEQQIAANAARTAAETAAQARREAEQAAEVARETRARAEEEERIRLANAPLSDIKSSIQGPLEESAAPVIARKPVGHLAVPEEDRLSNSGLDDNKMFLKLDDEDIYLGSDNRMAGAAGTVDRVRNFETKMKGLDPLAYKRVLLGELSKTDEVKRAGIRFTGTDILSVHASIKTADAQITLNRDFTLGAVYHALQKVQSRLGAEHTSEVQGGGKAKGLFSASLDLYDHLGINTINVSANIDVGGYAWARYGFLPTANEWASLKHSIRSKALSLTDPVQKSDVNRILASSKPEALRFIAALRGKASNASTSDTLGAYLLKGSSWSGSINLQDPQSYSMARAYTGKAKASITDSK